MKPESNFTYSRFLTYLKGLFSNKEEHDFEKALMRDKFEDEAFDGLSKLSSQDLEDDFLDLSGRLNNKTAKKKLLTPQLKIAASAAIMVGLISLYLIINNYGEQVDMPIMAEDTSTINVDQGKISLQLADTVNKETAIDNNLVAEQKSPENKKKKNKKEQKSIQENREAEISPQKKKEDYTEEELKEAMKRIEMPENEPLPVAEAESVIETELPQKSAMRAKKSAVTIAAETEEYTISTASRSEEAAAVTDEFHAIKTGKIVDAKGSPIQGAIIQESGTKNQTTSDENGLFSLQVQNSMNSIEISYIGFESIDIQGSEIIEKIMLEEEMLALNEVTVIGYSSVDSSKIDSAQLNMENWDWPADFILKPVPPGGYRKFKKVVYQNLDKTKIEHLTGKQKISPQFIVFEDGTLGDFNFDPDEDQALSEEFKRIFKSMENWEPAQEQGNAIATKIKMNFTIKLDE